VWFIDPLTRTLEVYRKAEEGYLLLTVLGEEPKVRVEPFDAIELDLELVWRPPESEND
jgi:hypothetical protein